MNYVNVLLKVPFKITKSKNDEQLFVNELMPEMTYSRHYH